MACEGGRMQSAPTGGARPFVSIVGAAALGRPRTWRKAGETGRRGWRPLRDGYEAVRFRRRGGRPRPPADMEEGWRDGPPGASAPTGWVRGRSFPS